jgi:hypothetical protein
MDYTQPDDANLSVVRIDFAEVKGGQHVYLV